MNIPAILLKLVLESRDWLRRAKSSLLLVDFSTRSSGSTVGDGASASHSPLKTGWTLYWLGKEEYLGKEIPLLGLLGRGS